MVLSIKTSCNLFSFAKTSLVVSSTNSGRDIIHTLLVSRHQNDVATSISSLDSFL